MLLQTLLAAAFLPVVPQPRQFIAGEGVCAMSNANISVSATLDEALGPEGYRMKIAADGITITGGGAQGLLWANSTIAQLKQAELAGEQIPCGLITDWPKYRVRGLTLDVGRKFHSIDFLKKVARAMSYYKLNVFHVHLSDCEIEKNPKADWSTKYAAFRLECESIPNLTATDGSYSKAEFREFMKYCKTLGVEVVPELDAPAHSLAFHRALGIGSEEFGRDHLDLNRMDECLAAMKKLCDEYLTGDDPVLPGPYFHIGTDEYSKKEAEKFRFYTDAMLKMVESYGRTPCMWGALTHAKGTTPVRAHAGIHVDIWHEPYYQPAEALEAGYSLISIPDGLVYIVPQAGYYYDYLNCRYLYDNWEPNCFGRMTIPADHPQLLGGKFAVWHDLCGKSCDEDGTWARILPPFKTLGQKFWSGKVAGENYEEFDRIGKLTEAKE